VAHDFNNILTTIGGYAGLLLEEKGVTGWLRTAVTEVAKAAERAAGLTRQLLTFSRRQPMQMAQIDLRSVIADITSMLRRLLGEHIQLQVDYGAVPVTVCADRGMMEQVIMNLVVNARDAIEARPESAPPGRLVLSTTVVRLSAAETRKHRPGRAGEFACLRVEDNGCGMSEETRQSIFEPFYTTKDVGKGTGLGLATVYGIVEEHSGRIEVDSAVGKGTEFRVYLPLDRRPARAAKEQQPTVVASGRETILLVEDETSVRGLAEQALSNLGYSVLTAESGARALQMWAQESHRVDLLLTDVVMPDGLTGFDLADRLHREKPGLKIIYTSGYSMEAAERKLRKGINLLPKPFSVQALSQTVRDCLDGK
jgi:two-component system, cell cycle sensor histidine kinase and response regulator CckA